MIIPITTISLTMIIIICINNTDKGLDRAAGIAELRERAAELAERPGAAGGRDRARGLLELPRPLQELPGHLSYYLVLLVIIT